LCVVGTLVLTALCMEIIDKVQAGGEAGREFQTLAQHLNSSAKALYSAFATFLGGEDYETPF
jgi:hypothetical protein